MFDFDDKDEKVVKSYNLMVEALSKLPLEHKIGAIKNSLVGSIKALEGTVPEMDIINFYVNQAYTIGIPYEDTKVLVSQASRILNISK